MGQWKADMVNEVNEDPSLAGVAKVTDKTREAYYRSREDYAEPRAG